MKLNKPHFRYNKRQRNGVVYLLFLILFLQGVYIYVSNNKNFVVHDDKELQELRKELDSLKQEKSKTLNLYKFNPNYITDEKGYLLGMSAEEIDRLFSFRASGGWVENTNHFQKITQVSDSLLMSISPLFKFPSVSKKYKVKKELKTKSIKKDINQATEEDLKHIYGIGDKLATRIIKYRNLLQGFSNMNQLTEVWGLSRETVNTIKLKFKIITEPKIEKININTASFKEVLSIVYLDYDATKLLFRYKDSLGGVRNIEEIKKIQGFPIEKYDRIVLYLQAE